VDVIGDAEHVEGVTPVEVDELPERERAVAPRRMRVELAEQRLDLPAHPARSVLATRARVGRGVVTMEGRHG
jgi:hypothetical protein